RRQRTNDLLCRHDNAAAARFHRFIFSLGRLQPASYRSRLRRLRLQSACRHGAGSAVQETSPLRRSQVVASSMGMPSGVTSARKGSSAARLKVSRVRMKGSSSRKPTSGPMAAR
ncbi:hypothetical protein Vafri_10601, partial [Volvox africanus]